MKSKMNIKSIVIIAAVSLISLFFINMSFAANTGKITVETANLRETADEGSKILEQLSMNKEVEIIEKVGNWYKVKANGITGYIREDLLDVPEVSNQTQNQNTNTNQTTMETPEIPEKLKGEGYTNATDEKGNSKWTTDPDDPEGRDDEAGDGKLYPVYEKEITVEKYGLFTHSLFGMMNILLKDKKFKDKICI